MALALVNEGGPAAVTMGTVAERAEVTRALVYKHFDNRADILSALYRREATSLDRQLRRRVVAAPDGFEAKLRSFIQGVLEAVGTHAELFVPLRSFGQDASHRRQQRSWDRKTVDYFTGLAADEFGLDADVARPAVSMLLAGITTLLTQARADRSARQQAFLEDLFVEMAMTSLSGLAAHAPRRNVPLVAHRPVVPAAPARPRAHAADAGAGPTVSHAEVRNRNDRVTSRATISNPTAAHSQKIPRCSTGTSAAAGTNTPTEITIATARNRMSPAPMKTPSRANTTPFTGCMTATRRSIQAASSRTAGSDVKTCGNTVCSATMTTPSATPASSPHSTIRRPIARATAASPPPSTRPIMACPAMAMASSVNASVFQISNETWYAASSTVPMRAATDVDSTSAPGARPSGRTGHGRPWPAA